ncbi:exosortase [Neorhodopirellula lusitana]|uniref:Exosortase n=1 Tax=Neorhodopirellula lusitana TaxID=445327 RepID=A0ABY1Q7M9_9BACT|nr:exosortase U [Neorhodopirellula lusitana]SMP62117.1 exosortase [Neorhodopirellula lusitana]
MSTQSTDSLAAQGAGISDKRVRSVRDSGKLLPDAPDVVWYRSVWTWFWIAALSVCVPMLLVYLSQMWEMSHYQYFPFAIAAVVALAWSRSDHRMYPPARLGSMVGLTLGGLLVIAAWTLRSSWLMAIAFVVIAGSCLNSMRGKQDTSLLAVGLPLLLLIRMPLGYDQLLVLKLQQLTTELSSLMLDVIGVTHSISGNVIQLPNRELFVAEACSGIQSVFTLAFFSTLVVVIYRRRLWLVPIYMVVAFLLAVAGNVIRVTTVAVAESWFEFDLASGWMHDAVGYLTLGFAALLLISFDNLICSILHPIAQSMVGAGHNPLVRLWNWCVDDGSTIDVADSYYQVSQPKMLADTEGQRLRRWMETWNNKPVFASILALGVMFTTVSILKARQVNPIALEGGGAGMFADGIIWDPPKDWGTNADARYKIDSHHAARDGEDYRLGRNADVWTYTTTLPNAGDAAGQFVVSQSYRNWHELCLCYQNSGWQLLDRRIENLPSDDQLSERPSFAFALFSNEEGQRGYLWFSAISERGAVVPAPPSPGRLTGRFDRAFAAVTEADRVLMLQMWLPANQKVDSSITKQVAEDFVGLRELVRRSVAASANAGQSSVEQAALEVN